jgi:hypothetical protein
MTVPPQKIIPDSSSVALADLRALVGRHPEAIYGDSRELALLLGHSEFAVEEARRWILEDGLEVRA